MGFWFKIAEKKDMSSSPARASKSQLVVEQPLTGDAGTHQCPKTKQKLQ